MNGHRVRELLLRVKTAAPPSTALRAAAEQFVARVIEEVGDRLERRFPGRIVLLRDLPLRWRITADQLDSSVALAVLAKGLADSIPTNTSRDLTPPRDDDDLVLFEDEAQWRASYLVAQARDGGAEAWCFRPLAAEAGPWAFLYSLPSAAALANAVCQRLAESELLVEILAAASEADLGALAKALGIGSATPVLGLAGESGAYATPPPPSTSVDAGDTTPRSRLIETLIAHFEARRPREFQRAATRDQPTPPREERGVGRAFRFDPSSTAHLPQEHPSAQSEFEGPPSAAALHFDAAESAAIFTRFGGVLYLLSIALELELGEILWQACLPETTVFAHAAAHLLGAVATNDPAPELFGGVSPTQPLPPVLSEQQEEVCLALLDSLVSAIPRRGLADWPEVILELQGTPQGRMLIARANGPFTLFAWPGGTASAVERGLGLFLARWPLAAPAPRAGPGLAELDPTGRIGQMTARRQTASLLPSADDLFATCLLAQIAGTLCFVFSARMRKGDELSMESLIGEYFTHRATLSRHAEELVASMPLDSIDSAVRLAGLDKNPGWIPWLNAAVRFEFTDRL